MIRILAIILALLQAAFFYSENEIQHAVYQFWWLPIVVIYLAFALKWLQNEQGNRLAAIVIVIAAGLLPVILGWLFHDTMTTYLSGAWFLILAAIYFYLHSTERAEAVKYYRLTGALITISLILLPISINRISVKLPNLSADSYFAVYQSVDKKPIQSAHYFQRIDDHEDLKFYLVTQVYFEQPHEPPLLQLKIGREHIRILIQEIRYEYAVGFFKLSLFKMIGGELDQIKLAPESDPARFEVPPRIGAIIDQFKVGDTVWLQLPHMAEHEIELQQQAAVRVVRFLFWLLIWGAIIVWRPGKEVQS